MKIRSDNVMWGRLFTLSSHSHTSLQRQLREQLVSAILNGHIAADQPLPSSRELAKHLNVARNTVVHAYQLLVDEGYLVARERSGFYVNGQILAGRAQVPATDRINLRVRPDWARRIKFKPSVQRNIVKPQDWNDYAYPFIYGQPDPSLIPVNDWRECCREAQSVASIQYTSRDRMDRDDILLLEQIQNRILPRRGIWASKEEILVTMGAQQALYLLAHLLVAHGDRVGLEDPGYPDARNIFSERTSNIVGMQIDDDGLVVTEELMQCDYLYVTPSHQSPTTVTMPMKRRELLLQLAGQSNCVIIEDDYEIETNYVGSPTPALKSLDRGDRVLYVGSLSKTVAPGLRIGYLVAPPALIKEARALRRLMVRHPPANNQRILALFLSLGHYDAMLHRLTGCYRERWRVMGDALSDYLPRMQKTRTVGGTSYWMKGPASLDSSELLERAVIESILFEPGDVFFLSEDAPKNYLRLGFSSIPTHRIEPGIRRLAKLIQG